MGNCIGEYLKDRTTKKCLFAVVVAIRRCDAKIEQYHKAIRHQKRLREDAKAAYMSLPDEEKDEMNVHFTEFLNHTTSINELKEHLYNRRMKVDKLRRIHANIMAVIDERETRVDIPSHLLDKTVDIAVELTNGNENIDEISDNLDVEIASIGNNNNNESESETKIPSHNLMETYRLLGLEPSYIPEPKVVSSSKSDNKDADDSHTSKRRSKAPSSSSSSSSSSSKKKNNHPKQSSASLSSSVTTSKSPLPPSSTPPLVAVSVM